MARDGCAPRQPERSEFVILHVARGIVGPLSVGLDRKGYVLYMETWLSGRRHLTANEAGFKSPREFESLRLRRFETQGKPAETSEVPAHFV
jgi:hypothetical protein